MTRIEAVVLDVGGVLLLPNGSMVARLLHEAGIDFVPAYERAHYVGMRALDRAPPDGDRWAAYLTGYVAALGVAPEHHRRAEAVLQPLWHAPDVDLWSSVVADSVAALGALSRRGVPLAVLSNSDGRVAQRLAQRGICQVGDGAAVAVASIVDSGVVGVAKPDPAIFTFVLDALRFPAGAVGYIGDSVTIDVDGARRAGVVPFHFDPLHLCDDRSHDHLHRVETVFHHLRQ